MAITLRCPKCGYIWTYRGNRVYATCPNCMRKVDTRKHVVSHTKNVECIRVTNIVLEPGEARKIGDKLVVEKTRDGKIVVYELPD